MDLITILVDRGAAFEAYHSKPHPSVPFEHARKRIRALRTALAQRLQQHSHSTRHEQLTALSNHHAQVDITAAEQRLNRELLFAGTALAVTIAGTLFFPPLRLLSLPSVLYSLIPIYQDAYRSARAGKFDVNILYAATQSLVVGRGYLLPANLGAFYYFLSHKLLIMAENRFEVQLQGLFGQLPTIIHKISDGTEVTCPLAEIAAEDLIAVYAGETIPVDGMVIAGAATVDQQRLTGEAQPAEKGAGDRVYASTIVLAGALHVRVTEAGTTTLVAQIGTILAQTTAVNVDRELWGKRFNDQLILPLVALGGLSTPFVGLEGAQAIIDGHPQRRMNISTALCALNYLGAAANADILVKDGRALELLHQVDTVVFDKTGTLTFAEPHVAQIYPAVSVSTQTVLRFAAATEIYQEHPLARAILQAAQEQGLHLPRLDVTSYHVGYGLAAEIDGQQIRVGSERLMAEAGIIIPTELEEQLAMIWQQGNSGVLVAVEERVIGLIEFHATLRPEADAVMEMVRQQGLQSYMLSGDHPVPTRLLAETLGIDHYEAAMLPEGKAAFVERLQAEGKRVCFIGDGINDAIAMKQADVAISLRGATAAATDTANIVLMQADLRQLLTLFTLTARYTRNRQATVGVFLTGTTIAIGGAYFLGFGLWHVATLNMIFFPLSLGVAMWPRRPWSKD
ncbi:MAG TPA: heavy metal translocating P-type ATPase [Caldilineaceae bacterium]|nr:heavy metal translocating P-type ATPase [Caldilineaceae bacterium]